MERLISFCGIFHCYVSSYSCASVCLSVRLFVTVALFQKYRKKEYAEPRPNLCIVMYLTASIGGDEPEVWFPDVRQAYIL